MRQIHVVVAHLAARGACEQRVDLALGHDDLVVHLALAQAGHDDFGPNVFAKLGERDTVALESGPHLLRGELVLFGDACDGAIELGIVDAQPALLCILKLHAIRDHTFEQLPFDDVARRRRSPLLCELLHRELHSLIELARGNCFIVHDGDDAVDGTGWLDRGACAAIAGQRNRASPREERRLPSLDARTIRHCLELETTEISGRGPGTPDPWCPRIDGVG